MSQIEDQFQLFIDSVQNYFSQVAGDHPEFSPPYILDGDLPLLEFTGIITVTGNHTGQIHFTAEMGLLSALLDKLGEKRRDEATLTDVIGEVANTISGNFRREFGQHFVISTPRVQWGQGHIIGPRADATTYIVPLRWGGRDAMLAVDFQRPNR
ncbi:MAG: chemotaxis protein CheX [Gammaproteobacteria bacterium]